jgi:hypothetical protein
MVADCFEFHLTKHNEWVAGLFRNPGTRIVRRLSDNFQIVIDVFLSPNEHG